MIKIITLFLAGIFGLFAIAQSSLADPVVLVDNGQAKFTIVTSETPNQATMDAVQELNYWINRITGVALPVQTVAQWNGTDPYIAVGASAITQKNGWDKKPFKQEEARVFVEANRIGLLGNDEAPYPGVSWEGTYYAALELVQKGFGARWVWPGKSGEIFTVRKVLSMPENSWTWAPDITSVRQLRNGYASEAIPETLKSDFGIDLLKNGDWQRFNAEQQQWLKRERMNKSSNIRFGHAFTSWWDKYSKQHPDWFAKPPGDLKQRGGKGVKLNISNPQVQDQIIKNWQAAWEKDPVANKFLNVSPNDSRGYDTRPATRAWDPPQLQHFSDKEIYNGDEPVLSDRYVKLWNILAQRIRAIDPQAELATYAYRNYRKPPLATDKIENNIVIGYVGGEGYYPDERFIQDEWRGWSSKGAQLFWRPNLFNAGHGIPYVYSKALYNDFQYFRHHGLIGFDFDTISGDWAGQGLNYYIVAEISSRPDATYDELTKEYFAAFGPAANSVQKYFSYFEEVTQKAPQVMKDHELVAHLTWGSWRPAHARLVPLFLTPEVARHGEQLLAQAEKDVQGSDAIYQQRLAVIRQGFEQAKLMAETFRKLQLDNPKLKVSYKDKKEILQPLWNMRQKMLTNGAFGTARFLGYEQRYFNLWDAFLVDKTAKNTKKPTTQVALTKGWRFRADAENQGVQKKWFAGDASPEWANIQVGKPWHEALTQAPSTKIGWYRVTFDVPDLKDTGEKVLLRFGAVDAETRMWLNGKYVNERGYPFDGNYDSWREPFTVDISGVVKTAAKNDLVIRVESENGNHAGITGDVILSFEDE